MQGWIEFQFLSETKAAYIGGSAMTVGSDFSFWGRTGYRNLDVL